MVCQGEEQRTHAQAQAEHVSREVAVSDLLEGKDGDSGMPMVGCAVTGRSVRGFLDRMGGRTGIGAQGRQGAEQGKGSNGYHPTQSHPRLGLS